MSTQPLEWCREWLPHVADHCHKPAIVIIWGKLMAPEALGPKCEDHAFHYIGADYFLPDRLNQWAVFDLRGLDRNNNG